MMKLNRDDPLLLLVVMYEDLQLTIAELQKQGAKR